MTDRFHVAFVCLGNICRSPMAASVFRSVLADSPLAHLVTVSSGGTSGWHVGETMDRRAATTLRGHGYPTDHSAAQFAASDFAGVDLVLAMDGDNLRALRQVAPTADDRGKVRLFRSFDPTADAGAEVPDPYYGGPEGFETVLRMVERASHGLLAHLGTELA